MQSRDITNFIYRVTFEMHKAGEINDSHLPSSTPSIVAFQQWKTCKLSQLHSSSVKPVSMYASFEVRNLDTPESYTPVPSHPPHLLEHSQRPPPHSALSHPPTHLVRFPFVPPSQSSSRLIGRLVRPPLSSYHEQRSSSRYRLDGRHYCSVCHRGQHCCCCCCSSRVA